MTKITIISGFLGAGKTTLIQKMIRELYQNQKVVLIENEFGEVGIDGGFMEESGVQVSEMNSGCICCSLVGDFGKNMREVVETYHPDYILVEPSGVGKLSDVMKSVIELEKDMDVQLAGLFTVVNGKKCIKQMAAFGEFFNNQIEYASTILISRSQEMTSEQLELVVEEIKKKNQKAAIITTDWNLLSAEQIQEAANEKCDFMESIIHEVSKHEHHEHHEHDNHEHDHHEHDHHEHHHEECSCGCNHEEDHHEHHHYDHEECNCGCNHDHHADDVFVSWGIETPHIFQKDKLEEAVRTLTNDEDYEGIVLRAKGMVPVEDGSWVYFDMVPGDYELRSGNPQYTGKLVVIGTRIDERELRRLFGME